MVDDGREHGDDRRADDDSDSRHYEQRRDPQHWRPTNGFFAKAAAGVAGLVFLIVFLMNILGWRFTGNGADIKANSKDIADQQVSITALNLAVATLTTGAAAENAATAAQGRDIADLKASLSSLIFINCGIYQKVYANAPTISQCVRANPVSP